MTLTKEQIEIMKAYREGKTIQCKDKYEDWDDYEDLDDDDIDIPFWDWRVLDYRIKPEKKKTTYRPYKDAKEMIKDINKRLNENRNGVQHPVFSGIWLKRKNYDEESLITSVNYVSSNIMLQKTWFDLTTLFYTYTYLDGTPFGIKE